VLGVFGVCVYKLLSVIESSPDSGVRKTCGNLETTSLPFTLN
jgi:hypothetical protein